MNIARWIAAGGLMFVLAGCDQPKAPVSKPVADKPANEITPADAPAVENPDSPKPATADESKAAKAAATIEKALAKLSAEDRELALTQKICPVSGEPLGSMDTPIKVTAGDNTIFVCCEACIEDFKNDPEKFMAKLKK